MKKTLRNIIAIRIFFILIAMWLFVMCIYFFIGNKSNDEFYQNTSSRLSVDLEYFISEEVNRLNDLIKKSQRNLLKKGIYNTNDYDYYKKELLYYWSINGSSGDTEFLHLDENGEIKFSYNNFEWSVGHSSNESSIYNDVKNLPKGYYFFNCEDGCFLNKIMPSHPGTSKKSFGYIVLRTPLESILKKIVDINHVDYILLTKDKKYIFSKPLTVAGSKYYSNTTTNMELADEAFSSFLESPINEDYDIWFDENQSAHYLVDYNPISKEIGVLLLKNISGRYVENWQNFINLVLIFLVITFLVIFFIDFLLKAPIVTLKKITEVIPLVGEGQYKKALSVLNETPIKNNPAEIVEIKRIIELVTNDVGMMDSNLNSIIQNFSERLDFIQDIIDSSKTIFVVCDSEMKIKLCNKFVCDFIGLSRDGLLSACFHEKFQLKEEDIWEVKGDGHLKIKASQFQSVFNKSASSSLISWSINLCQSNNGAEEMYICVGVDITERLHLEEKITYLATHDDLTGLMNRRKLNELLDAYLSAGTPFYFLNVDLNYFKIINDTLGHQAGDNLLIAFSQALISLSGENTFQARTGGDEFSVVITSDKESVENYCKNLIKISSNIDVYDDDKEIISTKVGLSIGIVSYPSQASNELELFAFSDAAMYENKIERNSSYHFYTGSELLIKKTKDLKYWSELLDDCLSLKSVHANFQSIHDVQKGFKVVFFESLCRVHHDGKVLVAEDFIHVINEKPIMARIDMFILEQTLEVVAKSGEPIQHVMVNISSYTLSVPNIEEHLLKIILRGGFPISKLVFEITEHSSIKDIKKTIAFMNFFRMYGVQFALDDFGTGYSSLSYLQRLPINFLKLDKFFIENLTEADSNTDFLKNIIKMVQVLGVRVIVEGVENSAQARIVRQLKAEYAQGYFFSKPQRNIDLKNYKLGFQVL